MSVIISNTTPINYLILIDHITVLRDLYGHVLIPQAVFAELQNVGTPAKVKAWVASHPAWLEVR
jgi:predicted nucleic acid-binding protein